MEMKSIEKLAALAHPQRLAVFRLLVRRYPDRVPAGAIAAALELKASTLSVYLATLRSTGLVSQVRAGKSLTYAADTQSAAGLVGFLFEDCCRARPDLCLAPIAKGRKISVLFICTGNSARSIMAEALLRDLGGDKFTVCSAGTAPRSAPNTLATAILHQKGHSLEGLASKNIAEFSSATAPRFDFVFTVCDRAADEECPKWRGGPVTAHWSEPDPIAVKGALMARAAAFENVYASLRNRIEAFAALPFETLDRASLQKRADEFALMRIDQ